MPRQTPLRRPTVLVVVALVAATACRSGPEPPPEPRPLTPDAELNVFARQLEAHLEAHEWQEVIAAARPAHYRTQVVEHGMPEPQYVAELFGLHRVGNNIRRGERVDWSDLERIEAVELESVSPAGADRVIRGTVTLRDGSRLRLNARVTRPDGRYVLTGGVG